jgi:hypothetical protein
LWSDIKHDWFSQGFEEVRKNNSGTRALIVQYRLSNSV